MFVYGGMGFVIARREPGNAIGWLMIVLALVVLVDSIDRLYLILDYTRHGAGWASERSRTSGGRRSRLPRCCSRFR